MNKINRTMVHSNNTNLISVYKENLSHKRNGRLNYILELYFLKDYSGTPVNPQFNMNYVNISKDALLSFNLF